MKLDKQYLNRIKNNDKTILEINLQGVIEPNTEFLDLCSIEDIQLLVEAMENNTVINTFKISDVYLGVKEMSLIAQIFLLNQKIRKVSFIANEMWPEALEILIQALSFNTSVTHLDLRSNPISEKEGVALIKMLRGNRSIVSLGLSGSYCYPAIGLGGSHTVEIPRNLMLVIEKLVAYNQSLLPKNEANTNLFFANKLPLKQEIKEQLSLLETEWQYISKDEVTSISLRALKYLQYSLQLEVGSEKEAIQDMFRRFPEALSFQSLISATKLFDKLTKAVTQLDNAGVSLSNLTIK